MIIFHIVPFLMAPIAPKNAPWRTDKKILSPIIDARMLSFDMQVHLCYLDLHQKLQIDWTEDIKDIDILLSVHTSGDPCR